MEQNKDKEYYIATLDEDGKFLVYDSEAYKLSEIEIINLIKICFKEERNKTIGRKIMDSYKDSTSHRKDLTANRLKLIGINESPKLEPTTAKKVNQK